MCGFMMELFTFHGVVRSENRNKPFLVKYSKRAGSVGERSSAVGPKISRRDPVRLAHCSSQATPWADPGRWSGVVTTAVSW